MHWESSGLGPGAPNHEGPHDRAGDSTTICRYSRRRPAMAAMEYIGAGQPGWRNGHTSTSTAVTKQHLHAQNIMLQPPALETMKPQWFLLSPFPPYLPPRKGTPSSGCREQSLINTTQDNTPTHKFANQQLLNVHTGSTHSHLNNPFSKEAPATHLPGH